MAQVSSTQNDSQESETQATLLGRGVWISLALLTLLWIVFVAGNSPAHWMLEGNILYDAWAAYQNKAIPQQSFSSSQAGLITGIPFLLYPDAGWLLIRVFSCSLYLLASSYFVWSLARVTGQTEFVLLLSGAFLGALAFPLLSNEAVCFTFALLACACYLRSHQAQVRWFWKFLFVVFLNAAALAYFPVLTVTLPISILCCLLARTRAEVFAVAGGASVVVGTIVLCYLRDISAVSNQALAAYYALLSYQTGLESVPLRQRLTPFLLLACYASTSFLVGLSLKWAYQWTFAHPKWKKVFDLDVCKVAISLLTVLLFITALFIIFFQGDQWNQLVPWWLESHESQTVEAILLFIASCGLPLGFYWYESMGQGGRVITVPLCVLTAVSCVLQLSGQLPSPGLLVFLGPVFAVYFFLGAQSHLSRSQHGASYRLLLVSCMSIYFFFAVFLFSINSFNRDIPQFNYGQRIQGVPVTMKQAQTFSRLSGLYVEHRCSEHNFFALDQLSIAYYLLQEASPLIAADIAFHSPTVKAMLANTKHACVLYRRPRSELLPQPAQPVIDSLRIGKQGLAKYEDLVIDDDGTAFLYYEQADTSSEAL